MSPGIPEIHRRSPSGAFERPRGSSVLTDCLPSYLLPQSLPDKLDAVENEVEFLNQSLPLSCSSFVNSHC
jgi:hypothetical protein